MPLPSNNGMLYLSTSILWSLEKRKKRGRKERRHKEAQVVLASATTAAAASLMISSQRKDVPDEENLLKVNHLTGRPGLYSQRMPQVKETLSNVKDSTGPWYCELCEDLFSSRSFEAPVMNSWEKPYFSPECGLCGGSVGAFTQSTDGQWVHAFCAEDSVLKGNDVC